MMSHLCNRCVRELLILARTWFAFGLPSKPGVTIIDQICVVLSKICKITYSPILGALSYEEYIRDLSVSRPPSKKQNSVALSTVEAKYIATEHCCGQLLWMRQTLRNYGYKLSEVPLLYDNKSALCMADNPIDHDRTKHIDIRYHFLRDHSQRGDIVIDHVCTHKQLVGIFTKPLDKKRFCHLRSEINALDSRNMD
jgi:hypothetical protein